MGPGYVPDPNELPPPPAAELRPAAPDDSISKGVFRALLWQLGAIVITLPVFFICWGLVQWFALVPVYLKRRRNGYPLAARGVLIVGFLGMLVNGGCAVLVFGNMSFH